MAVSSAQNIEALRKKYPLEVEVCVYENRDNNALVTITAAWQGNRRVIYLRSAGPTTRESMEATVAALEDVWAAWYKSDGDEYKPILVRDYSDDWIGYDPLTFRIQSVPYEKQRVLATTSYVWVYYLEPTHKTEYNSLFLVNGNAQARVRVVKPLEAPGLVLIITANCTGVYAPKSYPQMD